MTVLVPTFDEFTAGGGTPPSTSGVAADSSNVSALAEQALRRLGVAIVPLADRQTLTVGLPLTLIADNALIELGVIAADETPSTADHAYAVIKANAVHTSIVSQALAWWDDGGIPDAIAEEYTKMTAALMATSFGKSADPQVYSMLEGRIRRFALVMSAQDQATDAVMGVHRDLTARGLARWTVFDIPPEVGDAYVMLAANTLAPLFDKKPDPNDDRQANRALAQYIALPTSGERVQADYF